ASSIASFVSVLSIACAMSLAAGSWHFDELAKMLWMAEAVTVTNTSLALVGTAILWLHPMSIWLLAVPAAMLVFAYRGYISERERHTNLEFLYESPRTLHRGEEIDAAITAMLGKAREMFRADVAELTLFPSESGDRPLRTTVGPGNNVTVMVAVDPDSDPVPDGAV